MLDVVKEPECPWWSRDAPIFRWQPARREHFRCALDLESFVSKRLFCTPERFMLSRVNRSRCDGKLGGSVLDGGNQLLGADSSVGKFLMQPIDSLGNN